MTAPFGFPPGPTPALNTDGRTVNQSWVRFHREMYKLRPTQGSVPDGGELITGQTLSPFADNSISHTLGRTPVAVIPCMDAGVDFNVDVYRSAADAAIAQGFHKISFDTELKDYGGDYDASSNYRVDIPVDGEYDIIVNAAILATTDIFSALIYVNGSRAIDGFEASGVNTRGHSTLLSLDLEAGDYVEGYLYQGDATARDLVTGSGNTRMIVQLRRQTWIKSVSSTAIVMRTSYEHEVSLWVM